DLRGARLLARPGAGRARLNRRPRHPPRARLFRAAQPAAEAGGPGSRGGRGAGERAMIRSIVDAAHGGRSAPTLIVMLPPAYSGPEDFVRAGFVAAARARRLDVDLAFAALELRHVADRTVLTELWRERPPPPRPRGRGGRRWERFLARRLAGNFTADRV